MHPNHKVEGDGENFANILGREKYMCIHVILCLLRILIPNTVYSIGRMHSKLTLNRVWLGHGSSDWWSLERYATAVKRGDTKIVLRDSFVSLLRCSVTIELYARKSYILPCLHSLACIFDWERASNYFPLCMKRYKCILVLLGDGFPTNTHCKFWGGTLMDKEGEKAYS